MNPVLSTLLEIARYTIPSLIMLLMAYLIIQKFLVSELQRKQIALMRDTQNITMPLRMQAYERLAILTERIHPRQIMQRVYTPDMTVADLRFALVLSINTEWEHNLSQQIYVSRQVWETVKHMKETELALVYQIAAQLPGDAPAKELQVRLADYISSQEDGIPAEIALQVISEEAKRALSYGSIGE